MTNNQLIFLAMADRSIVIMDSNDSFWKLKAKTKKKVDFIKTVVLEINDLAKQQGHSTAGATDTKDSQRLLTATQAKFVESVLKSYYEDIADEKSAAIINFNMNDYMKLSIKKSIINMQLVHDTAAAIVLAKPAVLDEFNLTATDLPELQTAIDLLSAEVPTQSVMRSGNKTITAAISTQFSVLREEMNNLDNNVNTFIKISPKFVADYTNGRRMAQTGGGHTTAEAALMPSHFEALLGKQFTIGDVLTIRNHSKFNLQYGFTNTPAILPTTLSTLGGDEEIKVTVEKDILDSFGHWLVVYNANELDDVNVTILLAKA